MAAWPPGGGLSRGPSLRAGPLAARRSGPGSPPPARAAARGPFGPGSVVPGLPFARSARPAGVGGPCSAAGAPWAPVLAPGGPPHPGPVAAARPGLRPMAAPSLLPPVGGWAAWRPPDISRRPRALGVARCIPPGGSRPPTPGARGRAGAVVDGGMCLDTIRGLDRTGPLVVCWPCW